MINALIQEMFRHAEDDYPHEACGLVVARGKKAGLVRCRNVANNPRGMFILSPDDYLAAAQQSDILAIYHSHCDLSSEPSMADRSACEASGLPWHIVSWPLGGHTLINPCGYQAPYEKRPFVHPIHDCYSLARDWYFREWGLELPEVVHDERWWEKGFDLYQDHYQQNGFVALPDESVPQVGDAFLLTLNSHVMNHAAVYVGEGRILQHVQDRLSSIDVWGGFWKKNLSLHLRHESRC